MNDRDKPIDRRGNQFIDEFLQSEQKQKLVEETERQLLLAKQFCRYDKQLRICSSPTLQKMLEKAKMDIIRLMERS